MNINLPCPTDLAEVCPDISSQLAPGSARSVAQAVVDSVVVLLESGAFASLLPGSPANGDASPAVQSNLAAAASQPAAAASASGETAALRFLAAHLASNRAVVSGTVLLRVLGHLAQPQQAAAGAAAGPDGDSRPADEQQAGLRATRQREAVATPAGVEQQTLSMPADQQEAVSMTADEREAVFCDVVAAAAGGLGPADRQQVREVGRGRSECVPGNFGSADLLHVSPAWPHPTLPKLSCAPCSICDSKCRRCIWRAGRASCGRKLECDTQRACMARRWPAWRETLGAACWCCIYLVHHSVACSYGCVACRGAAQGAGLPGSGCQVWVMAGWCISRAVQAQALGFRLACALALSFLLVWASELC